ncbi:hypothetical protein [Arenimonas sp. SCN 70-307]|uniref:hypothetical protein n=1 Tax=Arenimonas sp. SCN 70-307 TaxID=1660089 RepID=UPI0025C37E1E|nr:hypothetical protein [Arenimonas sp. SCN 70-307]
MGSSKTDRVSKWAGDLTDQVYREQFLSKSQPGEGPRFNRRELRAAILRSLRIEEDHGIWGCKGIYIWYWRPKESLDAWPLYVGKSQRGSSSFSMRAKDHICNSLSGSDFIYSPSDSRVRNRLWPTHKAAKPIDEHDHLTKVIAQFSQMSVLLLPMKNSEATELAHSAEGMFLEAILRFHEDAGRPRGENNDPVMNSVKKAFNADNMGNEVNALKVNLLTWMT